MFLSIGVGECLLIAGLAILLLEPTDITQYIKWFSQVIRKSRQWYQQWHQRL